MKGEIKIGVLALQGDFREHKQMLESAYDQCVSTDRFYADFDLVVDEIRYAEQIDQIDALIIPGGESTAIARLTDDGREPIFSAIQQRASLDAECPMPVYGTCMGSIFLAREIEGSSQGRLALMDICVRRNAFGPQKKSFEQEIAISDLNLGLDLDLAAQKQDQDQDYNAVFIRAPMIIKCGPEVQVLATIEAMDQKGICMARQKNLLVSTFHPELTDDIRVHKYFLEMVKSAKCSASTSSNFCRSS